MGSAMTAAELLDQAEEAVRAELAAFDASVEALVQQAKALAEMAGRLTSAGSDGQKRLTAIRAARDAIRGATTGTRPPNPTDGESVDEALVERVREARRDAP